MNPEDEDYYNFYLLECIEHVELIYNLLECIKLNIGKKINIRRTCCPRDGPCKRILNMREDGT